MSQEITWCPRARRSATKPAPTVPSPPVTNIRMFLPDGFETYACSWRVIDLGDRVVVAEFEFTPRGIPRPAGEYAGLRDDAKSREEANRATADKVYSCRFCEETEARILTGSPS